MQPIRKYSIRAISLLLALQLLNLSIYAQDFHPIFNEAGSDEININETIVEYVVEVVLGHTNAIPEQSPSHKDLHLHKHGSQYKECFTTGVRLEKPNNSGNTPMLIPSTESFIDQYQRDIHPQPPRLA